MSAAINLDDSKQWWKEKTLWESSKVQPGLESPCRLSNLLVADLKVLVAAFFRVPAFFVHQGLEVNMVMASNNQGQLYQLYFSCFAEENILPGAKDMERSAQMQKEGNNCWNPLKLNWHI